MAADSESVDVAGLSIGYRRAGQGEPLLLLHGAFSDSREWARQLSGLAEDFDVIAVDCLGTGASADPPGGFALADYADTLAGFLRALGIHRPHVGGLSFGSVYALLLYRFHPEVVRSLILISAYAGWAGSLSAEEVLRRKQWLKDVLERPVKEWGADFLATVYPATAPAELHAEALHILRDLRPQAFRQVAEAFADADLRDVLPLITVPTLLLYGSRDERSPIEVAREMGRRIPGSRLVVVPDAGHGVNAEAPAEFNAAVREFLSGYR
ncbi:MAG: alpha/beta hydrolase [Actinomycetota bacterium]|nr:alpha/beta hydrolase [Actinomycetota bacterium]